jgi:hypothetical protein
MRQNIFISLFMFIILFYLSGCTLLLSNKEIVEKGLEENKSIVVMPKAFLAIETRWAKENSSIQQSFYNDGYSLGTWGKPSGHEMFLVEPGTYYIEGVHSVDIPEYTPYYGAIYHPSKNSTIQKDGEEFISQIGNVIFEKKPIYEDSKFTGYKTNREYSFITDNSSKSIAKFTVYPNEIVLLPAVGIIINTEACKDINTNNSIDNNSKSGWLDVVDGIDVLLNMFLDPLDFFFGDDDIERDSSYMSCPIKNIILNVKISSLDIFYAKVKDDIFKDITVRDLEFGSMPMTLESAKESEGMIIKRFKIEKLE